MEDIVYYNNLFDYYGCLLTDVQANYFKAYYCDNLSLMEISLEYNVSRNAIGKCLKEVRDKLDYYESKLKLYSNRLKIIEILGDKYSEIDNYI